MLLLIIYWIGIIGTMSKLYGVDASVAEAGLKTKNDYEPTFGMSRTKVGQRIRNGEPSNRVGGNQDDFGYVE